MGRNQCVNQTSSRKYMKRITKNFSENYFQHINEIVEAFRKQSCFLTFKIPLRDRPKFRFPNIKRTD